MPRPLRIQYEGAIYHLMSRGDRREAIFLDDRDRRIFLHCLGQACEKTGWQVHAFCLMGNHFHLVVETPQPNLCTGMKWLLGTYTMRFNRHHGHWGHLFGGRYKAQLVDERDPRYLLTVCDYVHLNPPRAGLIGTTNKLESFDWSSYPLYLCPPRRPAWLRVDRLLGEHGISSQQEPLLVRREFSRRMEMQREAGKVSEALWEPIRCGWRVGEEDFTDWLSIKLARRGKTTEQASQRRETDERLAERLIRERLAASGWDEAKLKQPPKSHPWKVLLAAELRRQTPMPRSWIARRLGMGSASYLSALLSKAMNGASL